MGKLDYDLSPEERARLLGTFESAGRGGLLAGHIGRLRAQFAWAQSEDFYAGYARALLVAAELFDQNQGEDRRLLAGMLLLHTAVVVEHLQGE